jgi:hypothetical protein
MSSTPRLPAHVVRLIAVRAGRDPRTVAKVIAGRGDIRPEAEASILAAIAALNIELGGGHLTTHLPAEALRHG